LDNEIHHHISADHQREPPTGCSSLILRAPAFSLTRFRCGRITKGLNHSSCDVTQRVFTDQNILENNLALEILAAAEQANQMAAESGKVCATMELAIEKLPEGDFGYYFVDHDARIIFWPEVVKSRELILHVRGVIDKSHISKRAY
jgi:hypothetical protein